MKRKSYLVCWVMEKFNTNTSEHTDHYQVFLFGDYNDSEYNAKKLFKDLQAGKKDTEEEKVYSVNLCEIIDSTEPHYLDK